MCIFLSRHHLTYLVAFLLLLFTFSFAPTAFAQSTHDKYAIALQEHLSTFDGLQAEMKNKGLQGTAIIHLTIDRKGRVKSSRLMQSTGEKALDEASLSMVKLATPFPSPPASYYPQAPIIEFMVPIVFTR